MINGSCLHLQAEFAGKPKQIIIFKPAYFFYWLDSFYFVVKMAPHIKLIYVDAKALAEPIRFLFAYGNIQYDDFRMTHDDFKSDKSSKFGGAVKLLNY